MSKLMIALALAATFVFASFTSAADAPKKAGHGPHGKVTAVAPDSADKSLTDITITISHKDKTSGEVKTEDKTFKVASSVKVTTGGKGEETDAKLSDVVVGSSIALTLDGDNVTAIKILPAKKKA